MIQHIYIVTNNRTVSLDTNIPYKLVLLDLSLARITLNRTIPSRRLKSVYKK